MLSVYLLAVKSFTSVVKIAQRSFMGGHREVTVVDPNDPLSRPLATSAPNLMCRPTVWGCAITGTVIKRPAILTARRF